MIDVFKTRPELVDHLVRSQDMDNRPVLNIASPKCKAILEEAVYIFKRFNISNLESKHVIYQKPLDRLLIFDFSLNFSLKHRIICPPHPSSTSL